jgi:hypothetical protein
MLNLFLTLLNEKAPGRRCAKGFSVGISSGISRLFKTLFWAHPLRGRHPLGFAYRLGAAHRSLRSRPPVGLRGAIPKVRVRTGKRKKVE